MMDLLMKAIMSLPARIILLGLTLLCISADSLAQDDVVDHWVTIDDNTHTPRSIVELYLKGDELYGDIREVYYREGEDKSATCEKCPKHDPRFQQKILGMTIISGLKKNHKNGKWEGGEVLDPDSGKIYKCSVWLEGNQLKLRGYIMFLYRTQTWQRYRP